MSSLTYFCPNCWAVAGTDAPECPRCGFRISEFATVPYESKPILALKHPIRENRMVAIQILGELKSQAAIAPFESILREEDSSAACTDADLCWAALNSA
jgi:hypothetical protein